VIHEPNPLGEQIALMWQEIKRLREIIILCVDRARVLPEHREVVERCIEEAG
jgi:hypothetical protein